MVWLAFVGLGLKLKHLTLEALEVLKDSDVVFLDSYTSVGEDITVKSLGSLLGKPIRQIARYEIEEENGKIIFDALNKGLNVSFAVIGDPFIATTHIVLLLEAVKRGIEIRIVHGISIYSVAISCSGLMAYKFGKTATVVYPKDNITFEYPYNVIKENKERELHTLLLLDLDAEKGVFMSANDALKILLSIEAKRRENVIKDNEKVLVIARASSKNQKCVYGPVRKLVTMDFSKPPHVIIIPGKLHFIEEEALRRFSIE